MKTRQQFGRVEMAMSAIMLVLVVLIVNFTVQNKKEAREADRRVCIANLKLIQGAKGGWANSQQVLFGSPTPNHWETSTPTDKDLFGLTGEIEKKPECPSGGTYTIGPINVPPKCSVKGHILVLQ